MIVRIKVGKVGVDPGYIGLCWPRTTGRNAEGQAADAFCIDRKPVAWHLEGPVIGVKAEFRGGPIGALDRKQTFSAEIEPQAHIGERPLRGNRDR